VVEPETEGTDRRARRALWGFRLAFYPAAIAVGAILLIGRGDAAADTAPFVGKTSQGHSISFDADGDGRPVALDTQLNGACPNGWAYTTPWRVADGDRVRFRRDGSRLWAMQSVTLHYDNGNLGRGLYTLDAWVEDDRVEGVIEVVEHVRPPKGTTWACGSQPVGFTARR
jgi:hypothetical protein